MVLHLLPCDLRLQDVPTSVRDTDSSTANCDSVQKSLGNQQRLALNSVWGSLGIGLVLISYQFVTDHVTVAAQSKTPQSFQDFRRMSIRTKSDRIYVLLNSYPGEVKDQIFMNIWEKVNLKAFCELREKESRPSNVNKTIMRATPTTSKLVELDLPSLLHLSCHPGFGAFLMNLASVRKLDFHRKNAKLICFNMRNEYTANFTLAPLLKRSMKIVEAEKHIEQQPIYFFSSQRQRSTGQWWHAGWLEYKGYVGCVYLKNSIMCEIWFKYLIVF